ncbi:hypothetical protein BGZ57DRAFT_956868 [Hyaloscypha finlandica]|nr:hypothetical protein BGZ57DRAFT_956868 [Hyaloscypha finlandica]
MAPSAPSLNPGDQINLIALIFGIFLSVVSIIIALATCRRTKSKPPPNLEHMPQGDEELMIAFAIAHKRIPRKKNAYLASSFISQKASPGLRSR